MSKVWVTSDWHFGHKGVERFRPRFHDHTHMEDELIAVTNRLLTKRDVLLCIGDMALNREGLERLRELGPFRKILIGGNHDEMRALDYLTVFDDVRGVLAYKDAFVTHIPIHPTELLGRANIHGHCHRGGPRETQSGEDWRRYYNAIPEFNDWKPVEMTHVFAVLSGEL